MSCVDMRERTFVLLLWFFFFKQKTAYEMRISDWSSDVCSSDLHRRDADRLCVPELPRGAVPLAARHRQYPLPAETDGPVAARTRGARGQTAGPLRRQDRFPRSEERRVGKECVRTGGSRWCAYN